MRVLDRAARALASRRAPLAFGIVTAVVTWFAWGAVAPLPLIHDEISYVLQARIFASGHWTAPAPPLPRFFEQPHVLVVPAVASKYPPGHALLLALGALAGAPWLMVLVLAGISGALAFALGRRLIGAWPGAIAWLFWIAAPLNLRFRASYYSEITTSALWLGAWWCLLEWRRARSRRWLLALSAMIGWGAITRPLTMLAFAIPVGVVVVRDVVRLRRWRDLALAGAVGVCVLGVLPLWSALTTGDWRLSPTTLYRRDYLPFDKPGLTVDRSRPARALPPVVAELYRDHLAIHERIHARDLPRVLAVRALAVAKELWSGPWLALAPLALVGLFALNGALVFGLATSVLLLLAYLPYAHWEGWTLYYLETTPVLCAITAVGLARAVAMLRRSQRAARVFRGKLPELALATACVLLLVPAAASLRTSRRTHVQMAEFDLAFTATLATLPAPKAIVFVKYVPRLPVHVGLVRNEPDLSGAPVWIVHDRGRENAKLLALAPDRAPFVFEERDGTLHSYVGSVASKSR